MSLRTPNEVTALTLLDRDGIAAIWLLQLSAARAYREGHKAAAAGIIEIAEAAEQECLRAKAAVQGIARLSRGQLPPFPRIAFLGTGAGFP